ncbi:rhomboid family intramembrane serine protease [Pelagicoccus sp. SDUM812002]|uniref:rhomboid family intramembrane serine protease n=1 Tax=Pelagicoccus sp. SDUM812002 TaxID=3041266 RepID=UPI00280F14A7|nr:rhomboid family intramembrane serine protease [Pelagicoccus sp. SDUM812002]MDQ8185249.1 rhomboid family intramembrane serine protease [Pelagicoccus sp. SDUM812002]
MFVRFEHSQSIKRLLKESPAVVALLAANILLFALKWLLAPATAPGEPLVDNPLDVLLALHFPYSPDFHIWQFLSHMFMHGNETHILFNMFGVFTFGSLLEQVWGTKRFVVFYLVAGLGASLIYTGLNVYEFGTYIDFLGTYNVSTESIQSFLATRVPNSELASRLSIEELVTFYGIYNGSMLGASGALYGILVAFAVLFPNGKIMLIFLPVPIKAKYFVPAIVGFDLFSELTGFSIFGGGIAHTAHIGGALIGFILMMYWKKDLPDASHFIEPDENEEEDPHLGR